jgi:hypothetical protein
MNQHLRSVPECGRVSPPAVLAAEEKLCDLESQACNVYLEISQTLSFERINGRFLFFLLCGLNMRYHGKPEGYGNKWTKFSTVVTGCAFLI